MKSFTLIFILLTAEAVFTATPNSNRKAGIHIALNKNLIQSAERSLLPKYFPLIQDLKVPDQEIDLDAKIGTLHIYLSNIDIHLNNLPAENIEVVFQEPNKIIVNVKNFSGKGHLGVRFKLGFISETDKVDIRVNKLDMVVTAELGWRESKQFKDKMLPYATIVNFDCDLNFDFDIHGSIIAGIVDLVKSKIKNYIRDQIKGSLKDKIIALSKETIDELIDTKVPVYVPINDAMGLSLDYSLTEIPRIVNNYLVVSSLGAIVNTSKKESLNPPFPLPDSIPDYDKDGKQFQMFLTQYSLNTAAYTLFLSNILEITIKSSDIPEKSPVQLNTKDLDLIIHGLADVYGKDKKVNMSCKAINSSPQLSLKNKKVYAEASGQCGIDVVIEEGKTDRALTFNSKIIAAGNAVIREEGAISGEVFELKLTESTLVDSKVKDTNIKDVEKLFNFTSDFVIPVINENYLKNISIKIPSVEGITFTDSTVEIKDDYIEFNLTPNFSNSSTNKNKKNLN